MKEFTEDVNANEEFTEHQVGDRKTNSLHPAKEELAAVEPGQQPLGDARGHDGEESDDDEAGDDEAGEQGGDDEAGEQGGDDEAEDDEGGDQ